jgi:hypothetical protein
MIIVAALLILISGCSSDEGPVRFATTGTVQLDGIPMSSGVIRFVPAEGNGGPAAVAKIIGGEFDFTSADGPIAGPHRVEIEATDHQNFAIDDESAFAAQMQKTGRSPLANNPVPAIYNSASTLTATVENRPDQTFDFDLKTKR